MSWRSVLEDEYTVKCKSCGVEFVDPGRRPNQRWLRGRCPRCGQVPNPEGPPRGEFQARCMTPRQTSGDNNGGSERCQRGTR
jgi:hypothetical protein